MSLFHYLNPKLTMLTLSVHHEPLNGNKPKNASALRNFHCSLMNIFVLSLSGYVYNISAFSEESRKTHCDIC